MWLYAQASTQSTELSKSVHSVNFHRSCRHKIQKLDGLGGSGNRKYPVTAKGVSWLGLFMRSFKNLSLI